VVTACTSLVTRRGQDLGLDTLDAPSEDTTEPGTGGVAKAMAVGTPQYDAALPKLRPTGAEIIRLPVVGTLDQLLCSDTSAQPRRSVASDGGDVLADGDWAAEDTNAWLLAGDVPISRDEE